MKKLPRDLPAKKIVSALEKVGFRIDRVSGSHYVLMKDIGGRSCRIIAPSKSGR